MSENRCNCPSCQIRYGLQDTFGDLINKSFITIQLTEPNLQSERLIKVMEGPEMMKEALRQIDRILSMQRLNKPIPLVNREIWIN